MTYSLFSQEQNFTKVLFGKPEHELVKDRKGASGPCSSGSSSPAADIPGNLFALKHMESLLEVVDPRVIRLPTCVPRTSSHPAPLCTKMPPPGFPRLPSPELLTAFEVVPPSAMMYTSPPISLWKAAEKKQL